ncbi:MAG: DUF1963 domain-containing protein [Erythrobacter sp.]
MAGQGPARRPSSPRRGGTVGGCPGSRLCPDRHAHHAGGYPVFVQCDFRAPGQHDDYDTCLLHLTSDDHVEWSDVGDANIMIRAEDLARGDFSKVILCWDCS